jgi:hypothetical protein
MAKANLKSTRGESGSSSAFGVVAAGLLVLVGVVFQLGELGYGHLSPSNFWLIAMITEGVWNVLTLRSDIPALQELARYWPLVLVAFGFGLLLLMKRDDGLKLARASADSKGPSHDRP